LAIDQGGEGGQLLEVDLREIRIHNRAKALEKKNKFSLKKINKNLPGSQQR
jgi:hypothetical protein